MLASPVHAATITSPSTITNIGEIVNRVMPIVYGLLGVALFGYFVYGGFLWLTSTGDPERIKKATDTMLNAGIGVAIVVFAYFATRVVGGILGFSLYG
ncbi:hypothetical protein JW710_03890 [Candidatus Dojkabacteria bacterium]|nr:hypothetical protein [Candidatus Dojkabacteria bacterium]